MRIALATGGAGLVAALALAGSASAWADNIVTVKNRNVPPGQEVCVAAAATKSFAAVGSAQSPGLKFRLIAQDGTVLMSTSGPSPTFAPYIYPGSAGWDGAGDYTVCAKNNGTGTVLLNYLTADGA
jgi:hypothetical protein